MAYAKTHIDLDAATGTTKLHEQLGLQNMGVSIHVFEKGQGFDFFHNHREQEEIYLCLQGSVDLKIGGDAPETVRLTAGDIARVDAATLRAIGNESSARGVVLISGACPHPYPAGIDHHDVIADVLTICGRGDTGFTLPEYVTQANAPSADDDC